MKYLTIVFAFLLLPFFANAGEKVDKSLDFVDDGYVDVANVNGEVKIVPWDNKSVKVTGELGSDTKQFTFDRSGNRIRIKVETKNESHWFGGKSNDGDNLVINLPKTSKVSYDSVNSNMSTAGITGGLSANSVNGNLIIENCQSRLKITTVNGKITGTQLNGGLDLETVNGEINLKSSGGGQSSLSTVNGTLNINSSSEEIKINTVSGNVVAEIGNIKNLEFSDVSGNATIHLNLKKGGNVNATTVSGNLTLSFAESPSAHFNIDSPVGGSINNRLSDEKPSHDEYGPGRHLQFTTLSGDGKVNVTTVSGAITLEKK